MKRALRWLAVAIVIAGLLLAIGYRGALADPVVRDLRLAAPIPRTTIVLLSDLHVAGPDMPPERLARLVAQVNALRPDLVLIAGDFVGDKPVGTRRYSATDIAAPLATLRSRFGTIAVLGNHDHWRDAAAMRVALRAAGVTILDNDAVRAGPFAIGGLDDAMTDHADVSATIAALRPIDGIPLILSHSPDPFPELPGDVPLMLAGHTHCGQIRLPIVGAVTYASEHGARYGCGLIREDGRLLVVGAGLGTSVLPLRFGAPPDLWRITIGR